MNADEKSCPFCAEAIKAAAVKCRFCGASLPSSSASFSASARLDESEILDLLSHLADKSLVVYEEHADGSGRERLRRRHRESFSRFWQDAAPGLGGPEQATWLARLDAEYDKLRADLELSPAAAPTDIHDCLALASAAFVFCNMRVRFSEPRAWLTHLLAAQSETGSDATRGRALNAVGSLAWRQGDYDAARTFLEEARALWQNLGDLDGLMGAVNKSEIRRLLGKPEREMAEREIIYDLGDDGVIDSVWLSFMVDKTGRVTGGQVNYG